MIIDEIIQIKTNKKNEKHLRSKGYNFIISDVIEIKTMDLNYGSHKKILVKCDICGLEKSISFQKYIKNINNGNFYACCSKCAQEKVKNTSKEKFGTDYYVQTDEYKKRYKRTSIKKYGVEHHTQNDNVKNKVKLTCKNKYGKDSYLQSDEYHIKNNEYLSACGVDNVFQLEEIKEKSKLTSLKKYGVEFFNQSDGAKIKMKKILNEKYNVDSVSQLDNVKEKIKNTNMKKYGVENPFQNEKIKKIIRSKIDNKTIKEKIEIQYRRMCNFKKSIIKNYNNKKNIKLFEIDDNHYHIKCDICGENFIITPGLLYNRLRFHTIICTKCNPIDKSISGKELQLLNFIKENYQNEIIINDRKILNGKELDIYLPKLKLAFEFNGLYWHSELHKNNNYHLNKTEKCIEQGIKLFHIWEDDWVQKQNIIKSMILEKFNNIIKINNYEIKEIFDNKLVKDFLNENHIHGFINSSIKIGLFYNKELVSLMTFIKKGNHYILIRFCNKLFLNIDSALLLFNYFVTNYKSKVLTYVDRSFPNDKIYTNIGFKFKSKLKPKYYYIINGIRYQYFKFSGHKNLCKIYDAGKLKYIFE